MTNFACMNEFDRDEYLMRRALELARLGYGAVSPNPMVGAVITDASGRIVGEGFHRCWGGPHAEVNAISSVKDKSILRECTVYVTLEPCSHYGKTPPCAKLLVDSGVKRVVVGCPDPFKEVSGRGIRMLREAGIEVTEDVLRMECEELNRKFMYAHTHGLPYVLLKWAQSSDGFMARSDGQPIKFSTPVTSVLMHRERAGYDAIMAGTGTILTDDPQLTCRLWPSRRLRPVVFDSKGRVPQSAKVMANKELILIREEMSLRDMLKVLYTDYGITSLMVEGGAKVLDSFLREGLYQELRIEIAPVETGSGVPAPKPSMAGGKQTVIDGNTLFVKQMCSQG